MIKELNDFMGMKVYYVDTDIDEKIKDDILKLFNQLDKEVRRSN